MTIDGEIREFDIKVTSKRTTLEFEMGRLAAYADMANLKAKGSMKPRAVQIDLEDAIRAVS